MSRSKLLYYLVVFLSLSVALVTYRFLALGWQAAFPVLRANVDAGKMAFAVHVLASPIALISALPQFLPDLRARRPSLHRWAGRIYAFAILMGGISGLLLAWTAQDRPIAAAGFGLLAVSWLFITARGVLLARAGQVASHGRWMFRSFSLTFAAVTLRLQLPVLFALGLNYPQASNIVAWTCWIPNLLLVEWLMRRALSGPGQADQALRANT